MSEGVFVLPQQIHVLVRTVELKNDWWPIILAVCLDY